MQGNHAVCRQMSVQRYWSQQLVVSRIKLNKGRLLEPCRVLTDSTHSPGTIITS